MSAAEEVKAHLFSYLSVINLTEETLESKVAPFP